MRDAATGGGYFFSSSDKIDPTRSSFPRLDSKTIMTQQHGPQEAESKRMQATLLEGYLSCQQRLALAVA